MKDPTVPSVKDRKKIMFYDSPDRQTRLKIRCDFDGISQSQFFRMMITGYIENDQNIYNFINKFKQDNNIQGVQKIKKLDSLASKAYEVQEKFALNELDSIFDTIEMETGI